MSSLFNKLKNYNKITLSEKEQSSSQVACYTWGCRLHKNGNYYARAHFVVAFSLNDARRRAGFKEPIFKVLKSPLLELSNTGGRFATIVRTPHYEGALAFIIK